MLLGPRLAAVAALAALLLLAPAAGLAVASPSGAGSADGHPSWSWPLPGPREIVEPYRAPAHEYGPGHRGMDIAAAHGAEVHAPAAGIVAFRGTVVDRPLLTVEHPGGYVTTFEPLLSSLSPGDAVEEGEVIGTVDVGGHAPPGSLHLGVRLGGAYINPMLLFGDVPRAVLLPCCAPL
ncbi:murein hydrolase activator EnvC family protein [Microbacterium hydrocarbonoxydans]|uniref:murein hydrolase activator EnvC family protein n=1 Tax=Microbacterium hydrocarbonoxydans TaxID=273678 RepID=UPI0007BB295C|nr:M23 family metallopeptidase [Microbacterium hydrocarbonoxydans]GAT73032.1 peptidase M23 [Microbacterium sp. HM58-2]